MIYFIQAGDSGPIKIGYTARDPATRRSELQSNCPLILTLLGYVLGDESKEAQLHEQFVRHHIHGDWFHPDSAILAVIEIPANDDRKAVATFTPIKAIRSWLGENQTEFAQRFGVNQSTVNRWENKGVPDRGTARMAIERLMNDLRIEFVEAAQCP